MKPFFCAVAIVLCAFALADKVPAEWSARYQKLVRAYETKNLKAFGEMCTNDLVWNQVDGKKKDRKETMAEMQGMLAAEQVSVREKLLKIDQHGNKADVHCEVFMSMKMKGQSPAKFHSFCIDSWRKVGGKWLIYKTKDLKLESSGAN